MIFYNDNKPPKGINKRTKQMYVSMANLQDFGPTFQEPFDPSLEIWDFLDKLKNERTILWNHECFH
jgi:hypothetical protein